MVPGKRIVKTMKMEATASQSQSIPATAQHPGPGDEAAAKRTLEHSGVPPPGVTSVHRACALRNSRTHRDTEIACSRLFPASARRPKHYVARRPQNQHCLVTNCAQWRVKVCENKRATTNCNQLHNNFRIQVCAARCPASDAGDTSARCKPLQV